MLLFCWVQNLQLSSLFFFEKLDSGSRPSTFFNHTFCMFFSFICIAIIDFSSFKGDMVVFYFSSNTCIYINRTNLNAQFQIWKVKKTGTSPCSSRNYKNCGTTKNQVCRGRGGDLQKLILFLWMILLTRPCSIPYVTNFLFFFNFLWVY